MKILVFSLVLLMSSSSLLNAMEDKQPVPKESEECPLKKYEYPDFDRITFVVDAQALSKHVMLAERVPQFGQQMNDMRNLLAGSTLINDALLIFQKVILTSAKPWEDEKRRIRNHLNSRIRQLRGELESAEEACAWFEGENTRASMHGAETFNLTEDGLKTWKETLTKCKENRSELMAVQHVFDLLKQQDLDEKYARLTQRENSIAWNISFGAKGGCKKIKRTPAFKPLYCAQFFEAIHFWA